MFFLLLPFSEPHVPFTVIPFPLIFFSLEMSSAVKKVAGKLKWMRLLQASPQYSSLTTPEEKLNRYTNFTLENAYEKYQFIPTHLLLRESVLPTMKSNPELLDCVTSELPGNVYAYQSLIAGSNKSHH